MIASVLDASWRLTWQPAVLALTAASTIGFHLVSAAFDAGQGYWMLPPDAMAWLAVVVGVRFWLGLCVTTTALQTLRTGWQVRRPYWVSPNLTLEAGLVAMALTLASLAGLLLLIVPGVILALRWSQAALLIVDGRARWFEAPGLSERITLGRSLDILAIWLIVGAAGAAVAWLAATLGDVLLAVSGQPWLAAGLEMGVRILTSAFGLAMLGAVYFELVPHADEL